MTEAFSSEEKADKEVKTIEADEEKRKRRR